MNRKELISGILSFENKIGMWTLAMNQFSDADFVIGYGFDNNNNLWKVYQTSERGMMLEWTFETEEEALETMYRKVKFQHKMSN